MQTGTIWIISGTLIIGVGLIIGSLFVYHGNKLNQQLSEKAVRGDIKESEKAIRSDIKEQINMLERMQNLNITNYDILSKKYPKGYYLFASNRYIIIPSSKEAKEQFTLDWSKSKVQFIDDSFIYLILEHFYYHPNEIEVENLRIILERKVGSTADGVYFNNIGLFVELLDDRTDEIIYVIGFKDVQSIPKLREPNPEVVKFNHKFDIGPLMSAINTSDKKWLRIKDMAIASGWKIIQK